VQGTKDTGAARHAEVDDELVQAEDPWVVRQPESFDQQQRRDHP
jgi:hypothetical protein